MRNNYLLTTLLLIALNFSFSEGFSHEKTNEIYTVDNGEAGQSSFYYSGMTLLSDSLPSSIQRSSSEQCWQDLYQVTPTYSIIYSMVFDREGNLYVSGGGIRIKGIQYGSIAKWDGQSWSNVGGDILGSVYSIAVDSKGNVYAGGDISKFGDLETDYLAMWDGEKWQALDGEPNRKVRVLKLDEDDNLYVGGDFNKMGSARYNKIAKWDGQQWSALGNGIGGTRVWDIAIDKSGNIYAGGDLFWAGEKGVNRIAKWDGEKWSALGAGVRGNGYGGVVYSLETDKEGNLYAGGFFDIAGNKEANFIAKWDGSEWSALGVGMGDGPYSLVRSIVAGKNGEIYAGGDFEKAGGKQVNYVAKWDGSEWQSLGNGVSRPIWDDVVYDMVLNPEGNLVVTGDFYFENLDHVSALAVWVCTGDNDENEEVRPGETTWSGSQWSNGLPDKNKDVTIAGNLTVNHDLFVSKNLVVADGASLEISPRSTWDARGDVEIQGSVMVRSGGSFISYVSNTFEGEITYQRQRRYGVDRLSANLYSSPVEEASVRDAGGKSWQYLPAKNEFTPKNGKLEVAEGYLGIYTNQNVEFPELGTFEIDESMLSFRGRPNMGTIEYKVEGSANRALIGNPYAAALDAKQFLNANGNTLTGTIWLYNHGNGGGYLTVNKMGMISGNTRRVEYKNAIGAAQGFFVEMKEGKNTITFDEGMRVYGMSNRDRVYLRQGSETPQSEIGFLKLRLKKGEHYDETMVGFSKQATAAYDQGWDATKILEQPSENQSQFQLFYNAGGNLLAIQAENWSKLREASSFTLGAHLSAPGNYSISLAGDTLLNNLPLILEDTHSGAIHDLRKSDYTFSAAGGNYNDRFLLHIGTNNFKSFEQARIYASNNRISLWTPDYIREADLTLFDAQGRKISFMPSMNLQSMRVQWDTLMIKGRFTYCK